MTDHTPGDPNVLSRLMNECAAGAPLGCFVNKNVQPGIYCVWEPTDTLPWIVSIHPDDLLRWKNKFPHMHRVYMFTETAEEMAQRLRDAGLTEVTP